MNILITGANGQMGSEFKKIVGDNDTVKHKYYFFGREELDITDEYSVENVVLENKIDIIVNCAAYTKVDLAEDNEEEARLINTVAPMILANAIKKRNGLLMHISTDYVFDGKKESEYLPNDMCKPLSVYGKTKYDGELNIMSSYCNYMIFRTSWLYGGDNNNFVKKMFNLMDTEKELRIVNDQYGSPTYVVDFCKFLFKLVERNDNLDELIKKCGIYHFSNDSVATWFDLVEEIYHFKKKYDSDFEGDIKIVPIKTEELELKAKRPKYSYLSCSSLYNAFAYEPRYWREALEDCIIEYVIIKHTNQKIIGYE